MRDTHLLAHGILLDYAKTLLLPVCGWKPIMGRWVITLTRIDIVLSEET